MLEQLLSRWLQPQQVPVAPVAPRQLQFPIGATEPDYKGQVFPGGYRDNEMAEALKSGVPSREMVMANVQTAELQRRMKHMDEGGRIVSGQRQPFPGHHDDASIIVS